MLPDDALAEHVASHALACLPMALERLKSYLRIPAISCEAGRAADVRKLASHIADDLGALGFKTQLAELEGALPMVAAERITDPTRPTVLIYGHLDLQPTAGEKWTSPPHEPVIRGERLFARGAADDMGGWVSHLAALEAWLQLTSDLPVNVRLVIEGEEEIGSPNLERYMDAYPSLFEADVMVLTDCENPAVNLPGLTCSLRGLFEATITCESLGKDVHSGLWGNMVPDPANALVLLLGRLLDENGRFALGRQEVPVGFAASAAGVPLGEDVIRSATRMLDDVAPLPLEGRTAAEWLWRQPALTVLSTTLPRPTEEKNAVRASASAKVSIRLAPGQSAADMRALLEEALGGAAPGGVRVTLSVEEHSGESWLYEPQGPAFDAVDRAYRAVWGRAPARIGVGGSIPFVALFGRRYADLPLVLNGVLDPESGAHGPDESLHLGVFERAVHTNVLLLNELGKLEKR